MSSNGWRAPGYTEERELGAGAQGRVVLARADGTGELVAVKYMAQQMLGDTRARSRFRSEAEMLSRLTDPHVAALLDYVETAEGIAIVMEAVRGGSLRSILDERGQLPAEAALTTLKGSLLGLAAAHSVGVIHRDYKPANVVVQEDGQSKLIDFGIALLTGQSNTYGTPPYMAPEQWRGQPSTPATDVYAATCVFVECVTGARPFAGADFLALMAQHLNAAVPAEVMPEPLRPLVAFGMAKDPGQRLWDVTAFVAQLESIACATYGKDWERQGLLALGGAVAVLAAAAPLGILGSALLAPGTVAGTGVGAGATGIAVQAPSASGHALGSKGLIAKVGGAKGTAGIGGTAALAILGAWLLWPSGPGVGGSSAGDYRVYFSRPGAVLANASIPEGDTSASPLVEWKITVSPTRAKPGTKVRMTWKMRSRAPWGLQYLAPWRFRCHQPNSERADAYHRAYNFEVGEDRPETPDKGASKASVWLYRVPPAKLKGLPTGSPIAVRAVESSSTTARRYDTATCSWTFDDTTTSDFSVPRRGAPRSGKYLISPNHPVGIREVNATVNGRLTSVAPESVGARAEGTLPVLTILKG